jgi:hypothetical protein
MKNRQVPRESAGESLKLFWPENGHEQVTEQTQSDETNK